MRKFILVLGALIFVNVLIGHGDVLADADDLVLSVGVKEEYLDNIFFTQDDKVDDFITTLSAGIDARKRTERLSAGLKGLFDGVIYQDNDDLNNLDQFYDGYVNYLVSERLSVVGEASLKNDSRPDRDVVDTGLILGTNVRKTQRYNGKVGYQLTELSNVLVGYTFRKEDYESRISDDYDAHSAVARWQHDLQYWLVGTKGNVTFGYDRYNYRFSRTDNYSLTLGLEKELSELYSVYIDLGGRYSEYDFFNDDDDDLNVNSDGTGGILKSGLKYKGEYSNMDVYILHDIAPASGRGRTVQRTSFIGSWRYRITEKISSGLNGGYYWNQGDISADPLDERTIRVVPRLIYRLTNNMKIIASYSHTWIDQKHIDIDKSRNDLFIHFTWDHTFFD